MSREMVSVTLYESGKYTVKDIEPEYTTQRLGGGDEEGLFKRYHCPKRSWKKYLIKLLSTNGIDKEIAELQKKKRNIERLKSKILKEINSEKEDRK